MLPAVARNGTKSELLRGPPDVLAWCTRLDEAVINPGSLSRV